MSKTIYIAGKMRGIELFNFPAFDTARDRLRKLGFNVLSPADMDRAVGLDPRKMPMYFDWRDAPNDFDLATAVRRDNDAVAAADAIYILSHGFAESVGGRKELELAMSLGKTVLYDGMTDAAILFACDAADTAGKVAKDASVTESGGEIRYTDPATGGMKGEKPQRFDLIPPDILWELSEHYGRGARKYGERNMEKGYPWSKTYAACQRHLHAFWLGEDVDGETGSLHLIAAAWHCITMAWFLRHGKGTDDRPKNLENTRCPGVQQRAEG